MNWLIASAIFFQLVGILCLAEICTLLREIRSSIRYIVDNSLHQKPQWDKSATVEDYERAMSAPPLRWDNVRPLHRTAPEPPGAA